MGTIKTKARDEDRTPHPFPKHQSDLDRPDRKIHPARYKIER